MTYHSRYYLQFHLNKMILLIFKKMIKNIHLIFQQVPKPQLSVQPNNNLQICFWLIKLSCHQIWVKTTIVSQLCLKEHTLLKCVIILTVCIKLTTFMNMKYVMCVAGLMPMKTVIVKYTIAYPINVDVVKKKVGMKKPINTMKMIIVRDIIVGLISADVCNKHNLLLQQLNKFN